MVQLVLSLLPRLNVGNFCMGGYLHQWTLLQKKTSEEKNDSRRLAVVDLEYP